MKRHLAYLKYVLRHKYYVLVAGSKIRNCSLFRLIMHDLSKFRPKEWTAYARTFYKPDGTKQYLPTENFELAWLHHQHHNPHHWQYWLLRCDDGRIQHMDMPGEYLREMVADWAGAGRAITGKWDVAEWYAKNRSTIKLSAITRQRVEIILQDSFGYVIPAINATVEEF